MLLINLEQSGQNLQLGVKDFVVRMVSWYYVSIIVVTHLLLCWIILRYCLHASLFLRPVQKWRVLIWTFPNPVCFFRLRCARWLLQLLICIVIVLDIVIVVNRVRNDELLSLNQFVIPIMWHVFLLPEQTRTYRFYQLTAHVRHSYLSLIVFTQI